MAERVRKEIKEGRSWDDALDAVSKDTLSQTPFDSPVLIPTDQFTGDAESLKDISIDEISDVTRLTSDDFMLIIKRSKEEAGTAAFDEVSADIEQMILGQKRQSLQSQFLQELLAQANVQILDETIFYRPEAVTSDDAVSGDVPGDGESENAISSDEEAGPASDAEPRSSDAETADGAKSADTP